jgi:hypothetical protein
MRNGSGTVILWRMMWPAIAPNYQAVLICMWTAASELHAVTAYRQGERQEVPRQGGHGRRSAFNDQTVNCLPCSVAPIGQSAHQRIFKACQHISSSTWWDMPRVHGSSLHACAADWQISKTITCTYIKTIILIIWCNNYYTSMNLVSQAEYAELGNRIRHPMQSDHLWCVVIGTSVD